MILLLETASTHLARTIPIKFPTRATFYCQNLTCSQVRFFQSTKRRRLTDDAEISAKSDAAAIENDGGAGETGANAVHHPQKSVSAKKTSSPRIKPAVRSSRHKQKGNHTGSKPSVMTGEGVKAFQRPTGRPADLSPHKEREHWQIDKQSLQTKFGDQGWNPRKKVSPDTMEGIRALHHQFPDKYTTPVLAEQFKVSPEAIRRMLKSKWRPSEDKLEERRVRWARRHDRIWDAQSEMGLRPKRTRDRRPEKSQLQDDLIPLMPAVMQ